MQKTNKVMIYPFDINSISLIRYNHLIEGYDFVRAVAPNGWGLTGKDASVTDGGEDVGLIIGNDFEEGLQQCDTVFFPLSHASADFYPTILFKMIFAANAAKNIICAIPFEEASLHEVSELCKRNGCSFLNLTKQALCKSPLSSNKLLHINTPVIMIASDSIRSNKFEVQLGLREQFIQMGYKVSQVGTRNYCEVFGFHSFPDFMFSKSYTDAEKIALFNAYIKHMELEEHPDVIILGIPGTTLAFSKEFPFDFGALAFKISQAITPDATVISTLYKEGIDENYFKKLQQVYSNRLDITVDCFNVSTAVFDDGYSKIIEKPQYITLDHQYVTDRVKEISDDEISVFNILKPDEAKSMAELLVNTLAGYASEEA